LLRPLPYPDAERLMILNESDANRPSISVVPELRRLERDNSVLRSLPNLPPRVFNLSGLEGREPEQIPARS